MSFQNKKALYEKFIEFVANDFQSERHRVNKRMFSVLLWCFLVPALISVVSLLLIKIGMFPRRIRAHLDWVVLIFPLCYSVYILSSEVLAQIPSLFRKGGGAVILGQTIKESGWRVRVSEGMKQTVSASKDDWRWIIANFRMDLSAIQHRNRYLTALAGAVFFLLNQGIDSLTDGTEKVTWTKVPAVGLVETSTSDMTQFVGLTLFLVILYISGSQTYHSLTRYLNSAELISIELEDRT